MLSARSSLLSRRAVLRLGAAASAGVGTALLAACGGTAAVATSSASVTTVTATVTQVQTQTVASTVVVTSNQVSTATVTVTASAPAPKTALIQYMSPDDSGRHDAEQAIFNDFAKQTPGMAVEIVSGGTSWDTLQEKLKTTIAAGQPINVFQNGWGSWGDFEDSLMELSSLFSRDKMDPYQIFVRAAVDTFMDKGKLWGFGIVGVSQDALAVNFDMLDAAGLAHPPVDPNDASWTMDKFLEYAQKLTKPDKLEFGYGGSNGGFDTGGMTRGTFFGQGPWDDTAQKAQMDQPGQITGLQYFKDLRDKYKVQPDADQAKAIAAPQGQNIFASGKIGMQAIYGYVLKQNFKWGLVALPHTGAQNISGRGYCMPFMGTKAPLSEQTWTLFKWAMQAANAQRFPMTAHYAISPVLNASDAAKKAFQDQVGVDPTAYELQSQHSHVSAWGMLKYANFNKVSTWLTQNFKNFDTGQQTAEDWGKAATQYIDGNLTK